MSKKLLLSIFSAAIVASTIVFTENTAHTYPIIPPAFNAGAPGQNTCGGGGCHASNDINTGGGSVAIGFDNGVAKYEPNTTYPMTVTISKSAAKRFGFQLCALDENGNSVGTLTATGANTQIQSSAEIQFINHNNAVIMNNSHTYSFEWKAPATNSGTITFYASGLAANNAQGSAGDFVYTANSAITFKETSSSLAQIGQKTWGFYPNPAQNQINILMPNNGGTTKIFSIDGKLLQTFALQMGNNTIDLNLKTGLYILSTQAQNGESYTERLIIK